MKKSILIFCLLLIPAFSFSQPGEKDRFCLQLDSLVAAAANNFDLLKAGLVKEKIISWGEKEYYKTKLKIEACQLSFITTDEQAVYKAVYNTDVATSKTMLDQFESVKKKIKSCLGESWKYMQNNSADFLFSSSYIAMQSGQGPEIKLMMYDNGTGMIVLELRVYAAKNKPFYFFAFLLTRPSLSGIKKVTPAEITRISVMDLRGVAASDCKLSVFGSGLFGC